MVARITPESQRQLDAATRAFRSLPGSLKNAIRSSQRVELNPIWRQEMTKARAAAPARAGAPMRPAQTIFKTGTRVKAGLPLALVAGAGTRQMSGGGYPTDLDTAYEFGSYRQEKYTRYRRRSPKGKAHTVDRRAGRQIPNRQKSGYIVYPAASHAIPRIIGTWVSAITDKIYDAIEGR